MFAIPPNNYDFYTEEEKYVRAARGRDAWTSRRGSERDERRHDVSRTRNEDAFPFVSFSPLSPERATLSPDHLLHVSFWMY